MRTGELDISTGGGEVESGGKVVLEGDIETMKSSDIVKRAYLGG